MLLMTYVLLDTKKLVLQLVYSSYIYDKIFPSFLIFFFWLFRGAPMAYGNSQARDQIGAAAAGLDHNHSNAGSEPRL